MSEKIVGRARLFIASPACTSVRKREREEGTLARRMHIHLLHALAARLAALRTPLPENSNDFGLLCACTGLCMQKWAMIEAAPPFFLRHGREQFLGHLWRTSGHRLGTACARESERHGDADVEAIRIS